MEALLCFQSHSVLETRMWCNFHSHSTYMKKGIVSSNLIDHRYFGTTLILSIISSSRGQDVVQLVCTFNLYAKR